MGIAEIVFSREICFKFIEKMILVKGEGSFSDYTVMSSQYRNEGPLFCSFVPFL